MGEEAGFLSVILQTPADETARLVYADWLDDQGEPTKAAKAEFIRLELCVLQEEHPESDDTPQRLQQLAAGIDQTWLAVVSRPRIETCNARLMRPCPGRWHLLTPVGTTKLRLCEFCEHSVHFCDTREEATDRIYRGNCVVISPAVACPPSGLAFHRPFVPTTAATTASNIVDRPRLPARSWAWHAEQQARKQVVAPKDEVSQQSGPGCQDPPLPKRRKGGRGRNRNIQKENWEEQN
jgi:uncharacterized protein (TIGR02996 family)